MSPVLLLSLLRKHNKSYQHSRLGAHLTGLSLKITHCLSTISAYFCLQQLYKAFIFSANNILMSSLVSSLIFRTALHMTAPFKTRLLSSSIPSTGRWSATPLPTLLPIMYIFTNLHHLLFSSKI